jgi:hypothetical protein
VFLRLIRIKWIWLELINSSDDWIWHLISSIFHLNDSISSNTTSSPKGGTKWMFLRLIGMFPFQMRNENDNCFEQNPPKPTPDDRNAEQMEKWRNEMMKWRDTIDWFFWPRYDFDRYGAIDQLIWIILPRKNQRRYYRSSAQLRRYRPYDIEWWLQWQWQPIIFLGVLPQRTNTPHTARKKEE